MHRQSKPLEVTHTPWKLFLEFRRLFILPYVRLYFSVNGIRWNKRWKIFGCPIIQRHLQSTIEIGTDFYLRSFTSSNPLSPYHPVILSTRSRNAEIRIGNHVGITGGTICAVTSINIGNQVIIGANCIIVDTDFHPLDPLQRQKSSQEFDSAPVIIKDDVFIGMNSIILKGVHVGRGSVIGAGSVVTDNIPDNVLFAGNPAREIRPL